ncbi:MAG: ATP-dependent Clp protease proteolytic subunit [Gammaproteobacteria bacterium]|nr:ATP-dependent Clp protease proteolytic subunit [Acholeplasmataceae bacterium]MCK9529006.1 ATP-dependent Clp protease proteolytic subunit [Gammaproteobacteria bacterium]
MSNYYSPTIIENNGQNASTFDIYSRLLRDRIIFIRGEVTETLSNSVIAQLLFLNRESKTRHISIYINTVGGSVYDGMSIIDTMNYIEAPVHTLCIGKAMSMGAIILAAGQKGERAILRNARVMIHQPSGGAIGKSDDILSHANEIISVRNSIEEQFSEMTGQSIEKINADMKNDTFLTAQEAIEYGIVDKILIKGK